MIKYLYFIILIFLFVLISLSCNKTKNPVFCSWKIEKISGENPFLDNAAEINIFEDHIVFLNKEQSRSFPVLITDEHLVLQTKTNKWLFTIDRQDDLTLLIKEKYAASPLWMLLKKHKDQ